MWGVSDIFSLAQTHKALCASTHCLSEERSTRCSASYQLLKFDRRMISEERTVRKKDHFLVPRKNDKRTILWCLFWKFSKLRYRRRFPHSFTFTNETNNTRTSDSQVKFAEKNRLSDWWWGFFPRKIFGPYKEITNMANLVSFYLVNFSRSYLNSDCHLPCDQLSDTEPKRLFRCKVLEQMVMLVL